MTKDVITVADLLKVMKNTLEVMKVNEMYLTHLDAEIGDTDHGINMIRGFNLANSRLSSLANPDVGAIMNTVGKALLEGAGGTAGALYGTLYLEASKQALGKMQIDKTDLAAMFEAGLMGVQRMGGGTVPGEKTMVDALAPAVNELKKMADHEDVSLGVVLARATEAAREGMNKTIQLVAKKGRARYFGQRSLGHQDIGATTTYLILRTLLDTLEGKIGIRITKYGSDGAILEEEYI